MNTKTFKNIDEAKAAIIPLHKSGKINMWRPAGRTTVTVSVFLGAGWCRLSEELFAKLAA